MKKLIFVFCAALLLNSVTAQTGSKELYGMFKDMPASMSNDDLIATITKTNLLDPAYASMLSTAYSPGTGQEYYTIGKYVSGKVIHLFYGSVNWYDKANNDYAMNIVCSTFNIKTGEMPRGGLQNYLGMVGQDALKRETTILIEGDKIMFTMKSTDKDNKVEVEKQTYKLAGYLEFVSRE